MTSQNFYKGIQHVVYISTSTEIPCEHCESRIGLDQFAESINHYIDNHGHKLLHVGVETSRDMDGNPWHNTVAVLGK